MVAAFELQEDHQVIGLFIVRNQPVQPFRKVVVIRQVVEIVADDLLRALNEILVFIDFAAIHPFVKLGQSRQPFIQKDR